MPAQGRALRQNGTTTAAVIDGDVADDGSVPAACFVERMD
jgi:hypothetical protein